MSGQTAYISLMAIEAMIEKKQYNKAIISLKEIDPIQLVEEEYAFYCLLMSNAMQRLGDYGYLKYIVQSMTYYRIQNGIDLYAQSKLIYGLYLNNKCDFFEAAEALLESFYNYDRLGKEKCIQRVLTALAYSKVQIGEIDKAIEYYKRAVEINIKQNSDNNVCALMGNIGLTYMLTGSLESSMEIYNQLNSKLFNMGEAHLINFYLNFSLLYALRGKCNIALKVLNNSVNKLNDYKRQKALYYEYLGWIYNLAGRYDEAVKTFKAGIDFSMKIAPESDLISQSKRLLADAYIGLGKYGLADKTAKEALKVAEQINERPEIAGCYRVMAQVEAYRNNGKKAHNLFLKSIEIYEQVKWRYELAVTRYQAACSGLFENGERVGMLYLALEYFRSEDLKHYIDKVESELAGWHKRTDVKKAQAENGRIFIAADPKTLAIVKKVDAIAESNTSVFLTGPTGCGKDMLARRIHDRSGRTGKFIIINCAAIPESMAESELFGFRKGAFTGADRDRPGLLEEADGGTIYLNEIGKASPEFQAKLLEVIETKKVRRLGDNSDRSTDFRIIAASNKNLAEQMESGKFLPDLYYRLDECLIEIPPLNQRKGDIPALVDYYLTEAGWNNENGNSKHPAYLAKILSRRPWPGNVRQLMNELQQLLREIGGDVGRIVVNLIESKTSSERDFLFKLLRLTDWNNSEAARLLGVSEGTIRNRIKKYDLLGQ